jgi:hypothetical protein
VSGHCCCSQGTLIALQALHSFAERTTLCAFQIRAFFCHLHLSASYGSHSSSCIPGIILTTHDKLAHYLGMLTHQVPIESQFIAGLVDHLNAEIVLGTVRLLACAQHAASRLHKTACCRCSRMGQMDRKRSKVQGCLASPWTVIHLFLKPCSKLSFPLALCPLPIYAGHKRAGSDPLAVIHVPVHPHDAGGAAASAAVHCVRVQPTCGCAGPYALSSRCLPVNAWLIICACLACARHHHAQNPLPYGIGWEELAADPPLDGRRHKLITDAARELERSKMARFDERSGNLYVTGVSRFGTSPLRVASGNCSRHPPAIVCPWSLPVCFPCGLRV